MHGLSAPVSVWCRLSQRATTNVSSATESGGASSFTTTLGDVLFPPGTVVSAKTVLTDIGGELGVPGGKWQVEGKPAVRRPFISAALLFISDLQGA